MIELKVAILVVLVHLVAHNVQLLARTLLIILLVDVQVRHAVLLVVLHVLALLNRHHVAAAQVVVNHLVVVDVLELPKAVIVKDVKEIAILHVGPLVQNIVPTTAKGIVLQHVHRLVIEDFVPADVAEVVLLHVAVLAKYLVPHHVQDVVILLVLELVEVVVILLVLVLVNII